MIAMAFSLYRFFRGLRSICAPLTAVICFSFLLTFIFILYQPTPGPGSTQRLGWQSWDIITMGKGDQQSPGGTNTSTGLGSGSGDVPEGVDWWNVTGPEATTVDSASFPLDVWAPLLPHDTGCGSTYSHCVSVVLTIYCNSV